MKIIKKNIIEYGAIILIVFTFLYLMSNTALDNKIDHTYPYGGVAQDYFERIDKVNFVMDLGIFKYRPSYWSNYNVSNSLVVDTPTLYHDGAMVSLLSGEESHNSLYVISIIFLIITFLSSYFVIKRYNKSIAIFALPSMLLFFVGSNLTILSWGKWTTIVGAMGLITYIWTLINIEKKNMYLLSGFILAMTYIAHVVEAIFAIILTIILFLVECALYRENFDVIADKFKTYLKIASVFLISAFFYIIQISVVRSGAYSSITKTVSNPGFPVSSLTDFHWLILILLSIGLLHMVSNLFVGRNMKNPKFYRTILFFGTLAFVIAHMTEIFGFGGNYPYYVRLLWPVYLSFFIGSGIYAIFSRFISKKKIWINALIFIIIFVTFLFYASGESINYGEGLMSEARFEGFRWLADESIEDTSVFIFYIDAYRQTAPYRLTERVHYIFADLNEYFSAVEMGIFPSNISTVQPDSDYKLRTGIFSLEIIPKTPPSEGICKFDYYFFDLNPSYTIPGIEIYQRAIAQKMLDDNIFTLVYNKNGVVILKRTIKNQPCLPEVINLT